MSPDSDRDIVDLMAEEFIDRWSSGDNCEVESFVSRCPERADEIRDALNALLFVQQVRKESSADFPQIPDYRITREIGRGGMGVVYEAKQVSLSRKVAVKVLPKNRRKNPDALRRFQLEARSAAQLHHTNIVPVFETGNSDEHYYYVMQYIKGETLADVAGNLRNAVSELLEAELEKVDTKSAKSFSDDRAALSSKSHSSEKHQRSTTDSRFVELQSDDFPSGVKWSIDTLVDKAASSTIVTRNEERSFYLAVADIGRQISSAAHYAHEKGIIHRDIKPANLILDGNGNVWVTDFGLAKTAENDLTRTGDVVGSLRYMSPERFDGQCDNRSDVYSIGATLYELLALRSIFEEVDRPALIVAIKNQSPMSLRQINPAIPRDLETIVEKSISKDPHRRYATCSEMEADLSRFVNGLPIHARKVGPLERLWLWARQKKALAASLALSLVLLITGLVGSAVAAIYFQKMADSNFNLAMVNQEQKKDVESQKNRVEVQRDEAMLNAYYADMKLAQQDWQFGQIRRMLETLRRYVPVNPLKDIRKIEWYYLLALAHQDLFTIDGHTRPVIQIRWSSKRNRLYSISEDGSLRIWDADGKLTRKIAIPGVKRFALNGDESELATVSGDAVVRFFDVESGIVSRVLRTKMDSLTTLDWCQSRNWLVLGSADSARPIIVDAANGEIQFRIQNELLGNHIGEVPRQLEFSPDGKYLAILIRGYTPIWNLEANKLVNKVVVGDRQVHSFSWHPDSRRFAAGAYLTGTYLFEVNETGEDPKPLGRVDRFSTIESVSFSPDGSKLLTGSRSQCVNVYDVAKLKPSSVFKGHIGWVESVQWRNDREVFSAARDGTIKRWSLDRVGVQLASQEPSTKSEKGNSPDGRWTWNIDQEGILRIVSQQNQSTLFQGQTPYPPRFVDSGKWVIAITERQAYMISAESGKIDVPKSIYLDYENHAGYPIMSIQGDYLAGLEKGNTLKTINIKTGVVQRIPAHNRGFCLQLSPDGKRLASASYGVVKVWDTASGKEIGNLVGHAPDRWMAGIQWDHSGNYFATISWDQTIKIWDARSMKLFKTLSGHQTAIREVYFSRDDSRLISIGENIRLWDFKTGREILTFPNSDVHTLHVLRALRSSEQLGIADRSARFEDLDRMVAAESPEHELADFQTRDLIALARRLLFPGMNIRVKQREIERCIALTKRAVELQPTLVRSLSTKAYAELMNGQFAQAQATSNIAVQSNPQDLESNLVLALTLLLDDKDVSREVEQRILSLSENHAEWTDELSILTNEYLRARIQNDAELLPERQKRAPRNLVVNTLTDEIDGLGKGGLSLREAVATANPGDKIKFNVTGELQLNFGPLELTQPIWIEGPGKDKLTISGGNRFPLMWIGDQDDMSRFQITLRKLTLADGNALRAGSFTQKNEYGGAIFCREELVLEDAILKNNTAVNGAAVFFDQGSKGTIRNCTIRNNFAQQHGAVAIGSLDAESPAEVEIRGSALVENESSGIGTAIYSTAVLNLTNCTIARNKVRLENSNVAKSNARIQSGGGIFVKHEDVPRCETRIDHCTIVENETYGIAIFMGRRQSLTTRIDGTNHSVTNSIVARNGANGLPDIGIRVLDDVGGKIEKSRKQLIVRVRDCILGAGKFIDEGGNQVGGDPKLGTLDHHGGPTLSFSLLKESPAIDAATESKVLVDQRGILRDKDGDGRLQADIGSFEFSGN